MIPVWIAIPVAGLVVVSGYFAARSLFVCTHAPRKLMQYRDEQGMPGWQCSVCRRVRPNVMDPRFEIAGGVRARHKEKP